MTQISADGSPLAGIRVVELSTYQLVPACGAVLAAFGADVIKIEPAGAGDFSRSNRVKKQGQLIDWAFEFANNGKRSVHLKLKTEAGRMILHALLGSTDIFLTNVRQAALVRATVAPESLQERYPKLIIAHATGYGPGGSDAGRPAFDSLAYWARGGIAHILATDDNPPVLPQGALGDLPTSISIVAGIIMALYKRERSGVGSIVDVSLYSNGIWANAWMLAEVLAGAAEPHPRSRRFRENPLYTMYRCRDGSWVQFTMFQPHAYWEKICDALRRPELKTDSRFSSHDAILQHHEEAFDELQGTIALLSREDLEALMEPFDIPWAPVLTLSEVAEDEQARINGYIVTKRHRTGVDIDTVAPPFQLRGFAPLMVSAPEAGQHTEQVLLEHGYTWNEIESLRNEGAF